MGEDARSRATGLYRARARRLAGDTVYLAADGPAGRKAFRLAPLLRQPVRRFPEPGASAVSWPEAPGGNGLPASP